MLKLDRLTKYYEGRLIFQDLDFHFSPGQKYAIYGPNGSGKTTLLGVLTGRIPSDAGEVIKPKNCKLGYLTQEANPTPASTLLQEVTSAHTELAQLELRMNKAIEALDQAHDEKALANFERTEAEFRESGGYELTAKARGLLVALGFSTESFESSPLALSGGWRMRVELARTLIQDPDVLILDEPTNHLDLPSLMWFETWLKDYKGTLIFVSHDRKLLDLLPDTLLHLRNGDLYSYAGGYSSFCVQRELELEQTESRFEGLERKKKQLSRFVERFGAKASKAAQANSKKKAIARLEEEQDELEKPSSTQKLKIKLVEPPKNHRIVCEIKNLNIGYTTALTKPIKVTVESGQKIAIIGANGRGKSTLLKTIAGILPALGGELKLSSASKLHYFAQNQLDSFDGEKTVLQNFMERAPLSEEGARGALGAFLFTGDDVLKRFKILSGGEKSRVGLCCLFNGRHNVLLLDEPTNHLDLQSVEALVETIKNYKGTVLLVSHDRYLIESTCERLLILKTK
ncbi:MAG: ABC-F family ATP-binding cassette domain-containing protein, partial [Oligoflexales bacterium]|nr:ABC-F family ATP-binding cassette domain-containing protein [Oligoflexales bacterium]